MTPQGEENQKLHLGTLPDLALNLFCLALICILLLPERNCNPKCRAFLSFVSCSSELLNLGGRGVVGTPELMRVAWGALNMQLMSAGWAVYWRPVPLT